jgi:hypothetical protein
MAPAVRTALVLANDAHGTEADPSVGADRTRVGDGRVVNANTTIDRMRAWRRGGRENG